MDRIVDPLFTTHPAGSGRGAGRGLAICHAIVSGHGGTIAAAGNPRGGTTIRVDLPASAPGTL
jgi:signal transduction histidine kinase